MEALLILPACGTSHFTAAPACWVFEWPRANPWAQITLEESSVQMISFYAWSMVGKLQSNLQHSYVAAVMVYHYHSMRKHSKKTKCALTFLSAVEYAGVLGASGPSHALAFELHLASKELRTLRYRALCNELD